MARKCSYNFEILVWDLCQGLDITKTEKISFKLFLGPVETDGSMSFSLGLISGYIPTGFSSLSQLVCLSTTMDSDKLNYFCIHLLHLCWKNSDYFARTVPEAVLAKHIVANDFYNVTGIWSMGVKWEHSHVIRKWNVLHITAMSTSSSWLQAVSKLVGNYHKESLWGDYVYQKERSSRIKTFVDGRKEMPSYYVVFSVLRNNHTISGGPATALWLGHLVYCYCALDNSANVLRTKAVLYAFFSNFHTA